jgi:hypothetical protein
MPNAVQSLPRERIRLARLPDLLEKRLPTDLEAEAGPHARADGLFAALSKPVSPPARGFALCALLAREQSLAPLLEELNADHQCLARLGEELSQQLQNVADVGIPGHLANKPLLWKNRRRVEEV